MARWAQRGYVIGLHLVAGWVVPRPMVALGSVFLTAELTTPTAALECVCARLPIVSIVGIFHHALFHVNSIAELLSAGAYSTLRRAKREWVTEACVHHQLAMSVPSGIRARLGLPNAMLSWLLGYSGTRSTPRYSWPTASHTCT